MGDFPTLATTCLPPSLPMRRCQMDELKEERSVVALVGPRGIGKSTIAISIANYIAQRYYLAHRFFPGGILYVDLKVCCRLPATGASFSSSSFIFCPCHCDPNLPLLCSLGRKIPGKCAGSNGNLLL